MLILVQKPEHIISVISRTVWTAANISFIYFEPDAKVHSRLHMIWYRAVTPHSTVHHDINFAHTGFSALACCDLLIIPQQDKLGFVTKSMPAQRSHVDETSTLKDDVYPTKRSILLSVRNDTLFYVSSRKQWCVQANQKLKVSDSVP